MQATPSRVTAGQVVTATGLAGALTAVWLVLLPHAPFAGGDAFHYLNMALEPKAPAETPYAFRVLTPWLAHQLGGNSYPGYNTMFRVITAAALAAAGPATYLICRRLGGTHLAGLVGVAGLLSLPGWLFNLYQPYLIDPVAMALTAWCTAAVLHGWTRVLPLLLTAAALARETTLWLVAPLYLTLRRRWIDLGTAGSVLLLMGPAILAMWAARQAQRVTGWPTVGELTAVGWKTVVDQRLTTDPVGWLALAFAASLGMWWVLGLYGRRSAGRLWWFLIPVFAQFALGADWSRFALYAFPVVVPAGVLAIWTHPARAAFLALIGIQSVAALVDVAVGGKLYLNETPPSAWIAAGLAACAVLVWHAPARWWRRGADPARAGTDEEVSPAVPAAPTAS